MQNFQKIMHKICASLWFYPGRFYPYHYFTGAGALTHSALPVTVTVQCNSHEKYR